MEDELWKAISRLKDGMPTHADFLGKINVIVNITNVAKEAGCSRTLIGFDRCRYPKVRAHILSLKNPTLQVKNRIDVLIFNVGILRSQRDNRLKYQSDLQQRNSVGLIPSPSSEALSGSDIELALTNLNDRGSLRMQLEIVQKIYKKLENEIFFLDTASAEILLRLRNLDRGRTASGRSVRRASMTERIKALSVVGKAKF